MSVRARGHKSARAFRRAGLIFTCQISVTERGDPLLSSFIDVADIDTSGQVVAGEGGRESARRIERCCPSTVGGFDNLESQAPVQ